MLRSSSRIFNNVVSVGSLELDHNIQNNVVQQFVRWRIRKPVHLGTAKTKLFRVPVRPVLSESEREELKHLHFRYKTLMRSLYAYFKEENLKLADGSKQLQEEQEKEDALFVKCMEENDRWNRECAEARNARLAEERLVKEMHILQKQRMINIEREEKQLEWEKYVEEQAELSIHFITEEKLDDAIHKAMEQATDFNFAITLNGKILKGDSKDTKREELIKKVTATA